MAAGGRIIVEVHPQALVDGRNRTLEQPSLLLGVGAVAGRMRVILLQATSSQPLY